MSSSVKFCLLRLRLDGSLAEVSFFNNAGFLWFGSGISGGAGTGFGPRKLKENEFNTKSIWIKKNSRCCACRGGSMLMMVRDNKESEMFLVRSTEVLRSAVWCSWVSVSLKRMKMLGYIWAKVSYFRIKRGYFSFPMMMFVGIYPHIWSVIVFWSLSYACIPVDIHIW